MTLFFFLRFSTGILKAVPLRKLRELCADVLVAALPVHAGEARAVKILRKEALKLPCRAESAALIKRFQPRRRVRVVGYTRSFHKRARCAVIFADRGEIDVIGKEIPQAPGILRAERAFSAPSAGQTRTCEAPRTFRRLRRDTRSPASHSPTGQDSRSARVRFGIPARYTRRGRREAEGIERPGRDAVGASREAASLRMPDSPPHKRNRPEKYTRFAARRYRLFYIRLHAAAVIQLVSSGQREALGIKLKTVGLRDLPQLCRGLRCRRPVCLAGFAQSVVPFA